MLLMTVSTVVITVLHSAEVVHVTQDGDGTPPGCDGGVKHSSADRSARD
jgi:hypothetical protein